MKKKAFEEISEILCVGDKIKIHYRSNWRGGDGRPHDHSSGKEVGGIFIRIFHDRICCVNNEFGISYKAIKSIEIVEKHLVGSQEGEKPKVTNGK